jgi:3-hydroxyacyl-CoA dehydrogenase/enoyl-CoA hydratase/3-hydroxybutyryl-CoA epimerase
LKDVDESGVKRGLASVDRLLEERVKRRRLTPRAKDAQLARVTGVTDAALLGPTDIVIEAVFEDLELKRRVLKETMEGAAAETIFASNTSSLPIGKMTEGSPFSDRVIGMHYFSPVEKMPLLEVITTNSTARWVTERCVDLGRRQGKTVIVVGDGPGFYTTRILGPYLNEAAFALLEGKSVELIDADLVRTGFPLGPLALLDEVGIDVGSKVAATLEDAFGTRMAPPKELARLLEAGRQGKKNKRGFYDYSGKSGGQRPVDGSVYADLGLGRPSQKSGTPRRWRDVGSVGERCLLVMVNEAVRCLEDGILKAPRDGDIGAIFGLGFPPFLGGPFFFVDQEGAGPIVERLKRLESTHGERFSPARLLVEHANSGGRFYPSEG